MNYLKEGEKKDLPNELGTLKQNCYRQNSGVLLILSWRRKEVLGILGKPLEQWFQILVCIIITAGPVRTDCWAPLPECLTQYVYGRVQELLASSQVMLTLLRSLKNSHFQGTERLGFGAKASSTSVGTAEHPAYLSPSMKIHLNQCFLHFSHSSTTIMIIVISL